MHGLDVVLVAGDACALHGMVDDIDEIGVIGLFDGGRNGKACAFGMVKHCELFFEGETGYLVVIDGGIHIHKTTDSGLTWNEVADIAYFDYSVVTHFFDKNHVEMFGYFSEGTHNLLVTEDGFETVSYLSVECPIMDYYGMGNVSHSKYTSDTYGCILIGMTLMKGSTDTNPYIMKDGWEHCEWVKQGIPECENNGMVQCRDLYAVDGVDTRFSTLLLKTDSFTSRR